DLARLLWGLLLFLRFRGDDLDLQLFERVVEVVHLSGLEVELVEREGDLVRAQVPVLASGLQARFRIVCLQEIDDDLPCGYRFIGCAHSVPPSRTGVLAMPHCASCPGRAP